MGTILGRRARRPATLAGTAAAVTLLVAGLVPANPAVVLVAWLLLGVTAGYGLSGSV